MHICDQGTRGAHGALKTHARACAYCMRIRMPRLWRQNSENDDHDHDESESESSDDHMITPCTCDHTAARARACMHARAAVIACKWRLDRARLRSLSIGRLYDRARNSNPIGATRSREPSSSELDRGWRPNRPGLHACVHAHTPIHLPAASGAPCGAGAANSSGRTDMKALTTSSVTRARRLVRLHHGHQRVDQDLLDLARQHAPRAVLLADLRCAVSGAGGGARGGGGGGWARHATRRAGRTRRRARGADRWRRWSAVVWR